MATRLNVVLYNPEIPQNTGNIIRSCYNYKADLHIIKPTGFDITDPRMVRASVTYVEKINYIMYEDWEDFLSKNPDANLYYTTKFARMNPSEINVKKDIEEKGNIYFVFGAESSGIPKTILFDQYEKCIRFPMSEDFRSFNLSNTVSVTLYEYARQLDFPDMVKYWDDEE